MADGRSLAARPLDLVECRSDVHPRMQYAEHNHRLVIGTVQDEVLPDLKAAEIGPDVLACPPNGRIIGEVPHRFLERGRLGVPLLTAPCLGGVLEDRPQIAPRLGRKAKLTA